MTKSPQTIAVTLGDPNGIGPEIAVKAAAHFAGGHGPNVVLAGDRYVVEHYVRMVAPEMTVAGAGATPSPGVIRVLSVDALPQAAFKPGAIDAEAGRATVAYLAAAMAFVGEGKAGGIVGCPHNETAINTAGIAFSGYPGLIAELSGVPEDSVFLMLVGGGLRIVHATLHEQLSHAIGRLTPDLVEAAAKTADTALKQLGIVTPRIGLFGINPHAGENGLFGDDDERITAPAVARLRAAGIQAEGPVGADLMLGRKDIDCFVAMYHDQGHVPVKLLAGRTASALSIGGGAIFSSTGHGSAFDIAGQGVADPEGVLRAIRLVAGIA